MKYAVILFTLLSLTACKIEAGADKQDSRTVEAQQKQYAASQPVPMFDWSLERHMVIQLYQIRNMRAATHSVWRSDLGKIEGDCPSMGFGLPYDTSLTNPLKGIGYSESKTTIEQAEPNGLFASKNTAATWVICVGPGGVLEPVYIETKVTVYPHPVTVDYRTDRVARAGKASVTVNANK